MIIIQQQANIERMHEPAVIMADLEKWARLAYKSEEKIGPGTAEKMIRNLLTKKPIPHESPIEHHVMTARFITCRGMTHEMVRHRLASYTQESTRYCNYSKGKFGSQITVIEPHGIKNHQFRYNEWKEAMADAERHYFNLINMGEKPQIARGALTIDLKTEIIMTCNLRQWMHVFRLRTDSAAHPQMQELMGMLYDQVSAKLPVIFPPKYIA